MYMLFTHTHKTHLPSPGEQDHYPTSLPFHCLGNCSSKKRSNLPTIMQLGSELPALGSPAASFNWAW